MEIKFIGQGYNLSANTSVAHELIDALGDTEYNSFKCLVAFASFNGVSALTEHILTSKSQMHEYIVIVGIDHEGTSKEALEELLIWNVPTYVYYFRSNRRNKPIFHPKIYLFKGEGKNQIIIGSNNLTEFGLTSNVEGAISIRYTESEKGANPIIEQVEEYFENLLNTTDINLKRLSQDFITSLHETGYLPSDERRSERHEMNLPSGSGSYSDNATNINDLFEIAPSQGSPTGFNPKKRPRIALRSLTRTEEVEEAPREEIINSEDWTFSNRNKVLIVEIGGPSRWKQISFAKNNFITFFEIPIIVGGNHSINLKYLNNEGDVMGTIENCHAIVKESSNYNLEPSKVVECKVQYNQINKPIIFFIKINSLNFIYHFETHGSQTYLELQQILTRARGKIRRTEIIVERLKQDCPSLNL
jgi:HKD family nuclease